MGTATLDIHQINNLSTTPRESGMENSRRCNESHFIYHHLEFSDAMCRTRTLEQ